MKEEGLGEEKEADKGPIAGFMRELALTGLATFFMTEDSVRKYLKELKLPKDVSGLLFETITKKKDDFYSMVAKEVGKVVGKVDIEEAVGKFLEKHEVHVTASVSFDPKEKNSKEIKHG